MAGNATLTIVVTEHEWVNDNAAYAVSFKIFGLNCDKTKKVSAKLMLGAGDEANGTGLGEQLMDSFLMTSKAKPGDTIRVYARMGTTLAIVAVKVSAQSEATEA